MLNKGIRSDLANDAPIYSFSDEETRRKIKRHIMDINDIITDKDIKNAKVPGAEEKTRNAAKSKKANSPATKDKKTTGKSKNVVDDTPGNLASPSDIVDK